jgi:hypothetical protein
MNDNNGDQEFHDDDAGSVVNWPAMADPPPHPSAMEALAEGALNAALTAETEAILNTRGFTLFCACRGTIGSPQSRPP